MENSAKIRFDIILDIDLLMYFVLNLEFSKHVNKGCDGPFDRWTFSMVDLGMHDLKY